MPTLENSFFSSANTDFRNRNYDRALVVYHEALRHAHEPMAKHIRFNVELVKRRISGLNKTPYLKSDLKVALRPVHQIVPDPKNTQAWISLGEDPYFSVDFMGMDKINAGWYQIDFEIETPKRRFVAGIYLDFGFGFSEDAFINLNCKQFEKTQRIVKFDKDVLHFRFDPLNKPGSFLVKNFTIQPLTVEQAFTKISLELESKIETKCKSINVLESIDDAYKEYTGEFNTSLSSINYHEWIEEIEKQTMPSAEDVDIKLSQMTLKPLISVVVPTYNTDAVFLCACIDSVIAQSYPNWELCIADDASPQPHVRRVLDEYQRIEPRIKLVYRPENGHISRASNSALELATGDYVALLDHDDELPQHALYYVALTINDAPEAQVIYTDEDKIDETGIRSQPHFKSDWNPDLFYSQNYVCHLGVYKRELLNRIGGFRTGVEGSQDQDLLLRCLPYVDGSKIIHIPRVLYHWRATKGSTALDSGEKSYTTEAGIKALRDYFSTINPDVLVEGGLVPNTYRLCWPIPKPAPLVSLLIPTRDKRELIETCVRSILEKTTYQNYEIVIIDNGSVENSTLEFFEEIQHEDKRVRLLRYDHPFNYSAINNFGVSNTQGEIIGLINNDIEVISPDWLTEMVSHAVRPDIGCVGAKLYYANDTIQHGGVILGIGGVANHSHLNFDRSHPGYAARLICTQNYSAVTAACLVVRRFIYLELLGLDENNLKIAFNDVDFCLRVRQAGYRNLWTPFAELYHYESISRGQEDTYIKKERFRKEVEFMQQKYDQIILTDPYYNINLTKRGTDFSLNPP